MITDLPKNELAVIGGRYQAARLVQQVGYTLGIAHADGPGVEALLPKGYLDETAAARDEVDKARQDKTIAASEAKQTTDTQNDQVKAAKVWRQQVVSRALRAVHLGIRVPGELTAMGSPHAVPAVLDLTSRMLGLLGENAESLARAGADMAPIIQEGHAIYAALQSADNEQKLAHAASLPAALTAFAIKKGELYSALKVINEAGHEYWAQNPQSSARYNLSILYHRPSYSAAPTPPAPSPPVTSGTK